MFSCVGQHPDKVTTSLQFMPTLKEFIRIENCQIMPLLQETNGLIAQCYLLSPHKKFWSSCPVFKNVMPSHQNSIHLHIYFFFVTCI